MYRLRAELLGDIDRVFWGNQQHFFYFTLNWNMKKLEIPLRFVNVKRIVSRALLAKLSHLLA